MPIWILLKKFQLPSAMGLRDFDLQSQTTLMGGGNPLIYVHFIDRILWHIDKARLHTSERFATTHLLPPFPWGLFGDAVEDGGYDEDKVYITLLTGRTY